MNEPEEQGDVTKDPQADILEAAVDIAHYVRERVPEDLRRRIALQIATALVVDLPCVLETEASVLETEAQLADLSSAIH